MPATSIKPLMIDEKNQFQLSGKIIELSETCAIIESSSGIQSLAVFSSAEKTNIAAQADLLHVGKMVRFKNVGYVSNINLASIAEIYSHETTFKLTQSTDNQTPFLTTPPANNPHSIFDLMQSKRQYNGQQDRSPHPILEKLKPSIKSPMSVEQKNKIKNLRAATKPVASADNKRCATLAEMEEPPNHVSQLPGTIKFDQSDQAIFAPSGSATVLAEMKSPRHTEVVVNMQAIPELSATSKLARKKPNLRIQTTRHTASKSENQLRANAYEDLAKNELVDKKMHESNAQPAEEKRASTQVANSAQSSSFMTRATPSSLRYHELDLAIQEALEDFDNPRIDIRKARIPVVRDHFAIKKLKSVMHSRSIDKVSMIIHEAQQYAAENITEQRPFCCMFSRKVELTPVEKLCKLIASIELSKLNNDILADIKNKLLELHATTVITPRNGR